MSSVSFIYDLRRVTVCVKGEFAEESRGERFFGSTDNIRSTVAKAECYLNYEKRFIFSVLSNFDSRCSSAIFYCRKTLKVYLGNKQFIFTIMKGSLLLWLNTQYSRALQPL